MEKIVELIDRLLICLKSHDPRSIKLSANSRTNTAPRNWSNQHSEFCSFPMRFHKLLSIMKKKRGCSVLQMFDFEIRNQTKGALLHRVTMSKRTKARARSLHYLAPCFAISTHDTFTIFDDESRPFREHWSRIYRLFILKVDSVRWLIADSRSKSYWVSCWPCLAYSILHAHYIVRRLSLRKSLNKSFELLIWTVKLFAYLIKIYSPKFKHRCDTKLLHVGVYVLLNFIKVIDLKNKSGR